MIGLAQTVSKTAEDDYLEGSGSDCVSQIQAEIYTGKRKLKFDGDQGYLRSLLAELKIPVSSQLLVFSKTSLQTPYITPLTPRAIYYNDRCYVAWIKGAPYLEIAAIDPKRGPMFYTLRNTLQPRPTFTHHTYECMQCHESSMSSHVPGLMMRSVYAGGDGVPKLASGSYVTTDRSPLKERWGGWYVTGTHGSQRHMGNEVARGEDTDAQIDMEKGANITDLKAYIEGESYLSTSSDIVALMVAEKQMEIQNLITKASFLTRNALRDESIFSPTEFAAEHHTDSTNGRTKHAVEPLVDAIFCVGEIELTSPVSGTTTFAKDFSGSAPFDKKGRSLSQLDLKTRVLRYKCSPLIYSEAFNLLPKEAKMQTYKRMTEILHGSADPRYKHLSLEDRKVIGEILSDTKSDMKAWLSSN